MSPGELQVWNWEASGWATRLFLVRFSYAFRALLMISWKLNDGAAVV
jgi:hypothetical protein